MNISSLTKQQKKLSREMSEFPLKFSVACYFSDASEKYGKVNSATITLVKYKGEKFGITNYHVIDAFRQRLKSEPNICFYIGNTQIDIKNTLLDEDKDLDLCTLYLEDCKEKDIAVFDEIPTYFYEIDDFTLGTLNEGSFVSFGGFPGVWRLRPRSNHFIFDSLSSGGTKVTEVTQLNIRCELALEKCIVQLRQHHTKLPENLGGLSGGPVFLHQELSSGMSVFKLVGIIYEHIPEYDSILVRPISFINEKLWIIR